MTTSTCKAAYYLQDVSKCVHSPMHEFCRSQGWLYQGSTPTLLYLTYLRKGLSVNLVLLTLAVMAAASLSDMPVHTSSPEVTDVSMPAFPWVMSLEMQGLALWPELGLNSWSSFLGFSSVGWQVCTTRPRVLYGFSLSSLFLCLRLCAHMPVCAGSHLLCGGQVNPGCVSLGCSLP